MSVAPTTVDRLKTILDRPGPYLTVYFDLTDSDLATQWRIHQHQGPQNLPANIESALQRNVIIEPDGDVAGWGLVVSADGTAEVFTSPDAPRRPVIQLAPLPYMAPVLEWDQRDIPHVVVVVSEEAIEIVPFISEIDDKVVALDPNLDSAVSFIEPLVREHRVELVEVIGEDRLLLDTAAKLRAGLPPLVRIEVVRQEQSDSLEDIADVIVRNAATVQAVKTVQTLKDFRFEKTHGLVREGADEVVDALANHEVRTLLVHDDPDDLRFLTTSVLDEILPASRSWRTDTSEQRSRLVDGVIAAALTRSAEVRVIPRTGDHGPADDLGVILDSTSFATNPEF